MNLFGKKKAPEVNEHGLTKAQVSAMGKVQTIVPISSVVDPGTRDTLIKTYLTMLTAFGHDLDATIPESALSQAYRNVAIGDFALYNATTPKFCVCLGKGAGSWITTEEFVFCLGDSVYDMRSVF